MANKRQVIDLHIKNPLWDSARIARELDCCDAYVRATFYRNGLSLPNTRKSEVWALGYACVRAGLKLADIIDLSETRKAAQKMGRRTA